MNLSIENSRKLELAAEDIIIAEDTDDALCIKLRGIDSSSINSETQMEGTVLSIPAMGKSWRGTSVSISSPSADEVLVELTKASERRRKVIIDTDGGIDDAVAILEALREPSLEILGITTLYSRACNRQCSEASQACSQGL